MFTFKSRAAIQVSAPRSAACCSRAAGSRRPLIRVAAPALLAAALLAVAAGPLEAGKVSGAVTGEVNGAPVPNAQVKLYQPATGISQTAQTNSNGSFEFSDVPAGTYQLEITADGFHLGKDIAVVVGSAGNVAVAIQLQADGDEPYIAGLVDAANNRPDFLPQSGVSRGSIVVGFGQHDGPSQLLQASSLPLAPQLGDFEATVFSGDQEFVTFPLYDAAGQFALVLPSTLPTGPAKIQINFGGKKSNLYPLLIYPARPSIFTVNQSGQGYGIFTTPDFNLITPLNSAKPGDTVIPWFTGGGGAPHDDQGGVFDFRDSYTGYHLYVGASEVPHADILYWGTSSYAGLGQGAFKIPLDAPVGCGVPVLFSVQTGNDPNDLLVMNPVLLPISPDGGPCGDPHSLPSGLMSLLFNSTAPIDLLIPSLTWVRFHSAQPTSDAIFAQLRGLGISKTTYQPPYAPNTCYYNWGIPGTGPATDEPLTLTGGPVVLELPGADFNIPETGNNGHFSQAYSWSQDFVNSITDGQLTQTVINLIIADSKGTVATANDHYQAPFSNDSSLINLLWAQLVGVPYDQDKQFTFDFAIDALNQGVDEHPSAAGEFGTFSDLRERGSHRYRCNSFAGPRRLPKDRARFFANYFSHLYPANPPATVFLRSFNWDPLGAQRTVIRGGAGIYYDNLFQGLNQFQFATAAALKLSGQ